MLSAWVPVTTASSMPRPQSAVISRRRAVVPARRSGTAVPSQSNMTASKRPSSGAGSGAPPSGHAGSPARTAARVATKPGASAVWCRNRCKLASHDLDVGGNVGRALGHGRAAPPRGPRAARPDDAELAEAHSRGMAAAESFECLFEAHWAFTMAVHDQPAPVEVGQVGPHRAGPGRFAARTATVAVICHGRPLIEVSRTHLRAVGGD